MLVAVGVSGEGGGGRSSQRFCSDVGQAVLAPECDEVEVIFGLCGLIVRALVGNEGPPEGVNGGAAEGLLRSAGGNDVSP